MQRPTITRPTDLTCRVTVVLESPGGETMAEVRLEDWLPDALGADQAVRLPDRVDRMMVERVLPLIRRDLRGWVEREVPPKPESFDQEFVRRVDHHEAIRKAREWLDPDPGTDADHEWLDRIATILTSEQHNERIRWE